MELAVTGHPTHSRALAVALAARADGRLDVHAYVLDLRKRGFVPVAGDLQGPGIVHHMRIHAVVDPATRTLDALATEQPNVAFEASAASAGESCRDPAGRLTALVGTTLDAGYARRLGTEFGGNRGCSHLLTLAQLMGSTVVWALDHPVPGDRRPGERVFRRDLVVDGHEPAVGRLQMAVQLTDIQLAAAPPVAAPMTRFARDRTLRLLADVDLGTFALRHVCGAERVRRPDTIADASWRDRADALDALAGVSLAQGVTAELFRRFGDAAADRPLLDALLMLPPALIQCMAANSEPFPALFRDNPSVVAMGGLPDSCYMWRRDGALQHARERDPKPSR
jgi:hypothetical protein